MHTPPDCILRLRDRGTLVLEADWVQAPAPVAGWRPRMFPDLVVPPTAPLAGFVGMSCIRDLRAGDGLRVWVRGAVVTLSLQDTNAGWVWVHARRVLGDLEKVSFLAALAAPQREALGLVAA
jgi:hypothetical protein